MADLTRFDFNAKKFLHSERVRRMTTEEVGAYVLLLADSWMGGKNASLPDDLGYLETYGKIRKISPRLLDMFPIVDTEWGPRRRNETLYDEWLLAEQRSNSGRQRVSGRYGNDSEVTPEHTPVSAGVVDKKIKVGENVETWFTGTPTHTKPSQPNPIQTNKTKPISVERLSRAQIEKLGFDDDLPDDETWKRCVSIWRRRKKAKLMPMSKADFPKFGRVVDDYGSAQTLAAFDLWASELKPDFTPHSAMYMFLKDVKSHMEAVAIMSEEETKSDPDEELRIRMKKKLADEAIQDEIDRKKRAEDEKFELENRDQI